MAELSHDEIFRRKEVKYLLTWDRYQRLLAFFGDRIHADAHGRQTIRSIYYDVPDFSLIRRSLQHPVYKEKLRVRTYGDPGSTAPRFAEIKKKYRGIVYKRRIPFDGGPLPGALPALMPGLTAEITRRELLAMFDHYPGLAPACFIGYERTACYAADDLRITFDENVRFRTDRLTLDGGVDGTRLFPDGTVLMEVKYPDASPLWLAEGFSRAGIFPQSMSKYGYAFTHFISGSR